MKSNYPDPSQVWQRVHPPEPSEQQSLQLLIRQLQQDLGYLKQRYQTGEDPTAGQLIKEYTGQIRSLRGILLLTGGNLPRQTTSPEAHSLSRCFDQAHRRLSAYQLRSSDPVYGPVFRELARQAEQHCFRITQLIGNATAR